jgi:4-diphosphocytidyl-2-C-methyl-D-erythritol kinase
MPAFACKAHAKINLALHVTGQRPDGYHLIESLVTFAGVHDLVSVDTAKQRGVANSLDLSGPFAEALEKEGRNLALEGATAILKHVPEAWRPPLVVGLEKNLPVASGIGGGSADAAAAILATARLAGIDNRQAMLDAARTLGADVPMCLHSRPLVARGIGEIIEPVNLPEFDLLLVNPGVAVSTPQVFRELRSRENPPLPSIPGDLDNASRIASYLGECANHLEEPARSLSPEIGSALEALRCQPGTLIARMSGSGATCFAIHESAESCHAAGEAILKAHPHWWVSATRTIRGQDDYRERSWQA